MYSHQVQLQQLLIHPKQQLYQGKILEVPLQRHQCLKRRRIPLEEVAAVEVEEQMVARRKRNENKQQD
jgi:hypothetical protein